MEGIVDGGSDGLDEERDSGAVGVKDAKAAMLEAEMGDEEAFEWTTQLSNRLFASDEAREGMQAFLQKRPAIWAEEDD